MLKGKLPQRAQRWHANIVKIAQPQRFSAERKIQTTIIMNFENKDKFKIFPLRSLDTNRAEIRYRFRCSRTAPEIHLKFARRTVNSCSRWTGRADRCREIFVQRTSTVDSARSDTQPQRIKHWNNIDRRQPKAERKSAPDHAALKEN